MKAKRKIPPLTMLLALPVACHEDHHPPEAAGPLPTVKVELFEAEAQGFEATEAVVGTVRAKQRATLEAKVAGRIRTMRVAVGDRIERGQVIAELDAQEIKAGLTKAKAVLKQAAADRERYARLFEKRSVTKSELDAVEARYAVAKATVAEAQSVFAHARVTAPFAGVVTHKLADVGDLASPGRPIVEIDDPSQLRLEAAVPEALSRFVGLGAQIPVHIASVDEVLEGVVSEVAPSADPNSRTRLVKIDLPTRDRDDVRSGQFGRALVPTGRTDILRVPTSSVIRRGQLEQVFVAADGKARLRLVKTGKVFGDLIEVVSGLDSGERVILDPKLTLRDGQPIEVTHE